MKNKLSAFRLKTVNRTNLFTALILILSYSITFGFWGCEQEDYSSDTEIIEESVEFQNYLSSYVLMLRELEKTEKTTTINGTVIYRIKSTDGEILMKNALKARREFINKHPEFLELSKDKKENIANNCLIKSEIFKKNNSTIRLKSGQESPTPTYAEYYLPTYSSKWPSTHFYISFASFDSAFTYISDYPYEVAIMVFTDGSAMLIMDCYATSTSMQLTTYGCYEAVYHLHPSGNMEYSPEDLACADSIQNYYEQNCPNGETPCFYILAPDGTRYNGE